MDKISFLYFLHIPSENTCICHTGEVYLSGMRLIDFSLKNREFNMIITNQSWQITSGDLQLTFSADHGPMPQTVSVKRFDGPLLPVIIEEGTAFSIADGNGNTFVPRLTAPPSFYKENDADYVTFSNLAFVDQNGNVIPKLTGVFQYEIFPDGTVFTDCFFLSDRADKMTYRDLKVSLNTDVSSFDDTRYGLLHRPAKLDGAVIQDLSPKRFVPRNTPQNFPEIMPLVTFNNFKEYGEDLYFEFFMEGGTTLSGNRGENETTLSWQNNSPKIEWNFQNKPAERNHLVFQFRNRWGWVICSPQKERPMPPMTMYHYFDNTVRYPSNEVIKALHDSGCDILILHENWRLDLQNNGFPHDEKRFKEVIELAHKYDIRVAVYIRGAELSAKEQACSWFDRYLIKDYDGLYMDYGGALTHTYAPSEVFVDGRTGFRDQYMKLRSIRERVGKNGLFFSHTGTHYSALEMRHMTGYVSGEGERGMLIRGRKEYEYFSMAMVGCGTLWSAAFPEYSTRQIVPFVASAGQYPHSALGEQFISCSLVHPKEPGINDRCFRPIWKLWKLFRNEQNIRIFNDCNSENIFPRDRETGHYLMISENNSKALLIVANFSKESRKVSVTPDWNKTGFSPEGKKQFLLTPDENTPGNAVEYDQNELTVSLDGFACAGFYLDENTPDFTEYLRPYHQVDCPEGKAWLKEIAEQKEFRTNPPAWNKVLLTLSIADMPAFGYEDSMTVDLFDNDSWVIKFNDDGSFEKLYPILTDAGISLTTGETSAEIDLGKLLPSGRHHLGVYATHLGEPFYSFFTARFSDGKENSYEIVFRNDLEDDRAYLHFDVIIP